MALAWLARGEGRALVDYLPQALQSIPDLPTLGRMQQAFASFAAVPLPPWLRDAVRLGGGVPMVSWEGPWGNPAAPLRQQCALRRPWRGGSWSHAAALRPCCPRRPPAWARRASHAVLPHAPARSCAAQVDRTIDFLSELLGDLLPPVSGGYWGALMGLTAAAMLPLAAARADRDLAKGIIPMIASVFLTSMAVFGMLTPSIGMHLFWTEASAWAGQRPGHGAVRGPCMGRTGTLP